jgi:hypothetical protein
MQPPHDKARYPGRRGLQHGKVPDARLVKSAAIVDDQHVAWFGLAERFEEDVDASVMANGQYPARDSVASDYRADTRRRSTNGHFLAHTSIGDQRRGQIGEAPQHSVSLASVVHGSVSPAGGPFGDNQRSTPRHST